MNLNSNIDTNNNKQLSKGSKNRKDKSVLEEQNSDFNKSVDSQDDIGPYDPNNKISVLRKRNFNFKQTDDNMMNEKGLKKLKSINIDAMDLTSENISSKNNTNIDHHSQTYSKKSRENQNQTQEIQKKPTRMQEENIEDANNINKLIPEGLSDSSSVSSTFSMYLEKVTSQNIIPNFSQNNVVESNDTTKNDNIAPPIRISLQGQIN